MQARRGGRGTRLKVRSFSRRALQSSLVVLDKENIRRYRVVDAGASANSSFFGAHAVRRKSLFLFPPPLPLPDNDETLTFREFYGGEKKVIYDVVE